jgi:hypothetical protein
MMRFRGGGVGHKATREATDSFRKDRDPLDARVTGARHEADELDDDDSKSIRDMVVEETEGVENVDGDQEEDYGYEREDSEDEPDTDDEAEPLIDEHVDFGPEDDGGAVDPDMDAFGYADL